MPTAPFTQQFIINGQFFGTTDRYWQRCHESVMPPQSLAFFCPVCADVWARCPVTSNNTGAVSDFQVYKLHCRKHPPRHQQQVAGSLFLSWDNELSNAFPPEMLRRELLLHLDLYPEAL